jgi:hypothetical protein
MSNCWLAPVGSLALLLLLVLCMGQLLWWEPAAGVMLLPVPACVRQL